MKNTFYIYEKLHFQALLRKKGKKYIYWEKMTKILNFLKTKIIFKVKLSAQKKEKKPINYYSLQKINTY